MVLVAGTLIILRLAILFVPIGHLVRSMHYCIEVLQLGKINPSISTVIDHATSAVHRYPTAVRLYRRSYEPILSRYHGMNFLKIG